MGSLSRFPSGRGYSAAEIVTGDPLDDASHVDALIHQAHLENVAGYVAAGKADGAELFIGGNVLGQAFDEYSELKNVHVTLTDGLG